MAAAPALPTTGAAGHADREAVYDRVHLDMALDLLVGRFDSVAKEQKDTKNSPGSRANTTAAARFMRAPFYHRRGTCPLPSGRPFGFRFVITAWPDPAQVNAADRRI